MATASVNIGTATAGSVVLGDLKAGMNIRKGACIGIAEIGGETAIYEVSSTSNAGSFCGFAVENYVAGAEVRVASIRGSTITPIVTEGLELRSGSKVFLSPVLGEITESAPIGAGNVVIQVGVATSTTNIILLTDFRVG